MNKNKAIAKIMIMLILTMMFSYTTFAEVTDTTTDVVEETTNEEDTTEEVTEESITAIISIDLGYEVLVTVDESGVIVAIEIVEEVTDEDATEEDATEEDATEEDATEEDATEEDATEEDATEEDATEEDATEEDATEEDATEEDAIDNPFVALIGLPLTDGIELLIEDINTEEDFKFEIEVYADDESLYNIFIDLIVDTFGEAVEVESEENEFNPNSERFEDAKEFGITNGKMNLLNKLGVSHNDDSILDYSEWANKSVKEIMAEIKANKAKSDIEDSDENDIEDLDENDIEDLDENDAEENDVEDSGEEEEEEEEEESEKKSEKKSNNGKSKNK